MTAVWYRDFLLLAFFLEIPYIVQNLLLFIITAMPFFLIDLKGKSHSWKGKTKTTVFGSVLILLAHIYSHIICMM